ncbi:MAG: VOC family protein [Nitrososphaerota archaeon]
MTKPIPDGFTTATASLTVREASKAIEFYKKAFDAKELYRFPNPDGKILHAEIMIGNSIVMLNDEMLQMNCQSPQSIGGTGSSIFLYVNDADATFNKAVSAGAKPLMPLMDAFWGDRFGSIQDPFGHVWSIATHKKDMTPDEISKAGQEMFKNMGK